MSQKSMHSRDSAEQAVRAVRRKTCKQYSAEEKIQIVVPGLRGEDSIAELCRRAGIAEGFYYSGSKAFLEAGKKRLADFYAAVDRSTDRAPKRALPSMLAA